MNSDTQKDSAPTSPAAAQDAKYLLIVGGLLMVIIVTLALLWMTERGKRIDAERNLAQASKQSAGMQALFSQLQQAGEAGGNLAADFSGKPVQRDDLKPTPGTLNGEKVTVFDISASAGKRIGFQPGDVVRVSPAPASATTRP